jgi:hypothetical protein
MALDRRPKTLACDLLPSLDDGFGNDVGFSFKFALGVALSLDQSSCNSLHVISVCDKQRLTTLVQNHLQQPHMRGPRKRHLATTPPCLPHLISSVPNTLLQPSSMYVG